MVMAFMIVAIPVMAQEGEVVEEVVGAPAFDLVWLNGLIAVFLPLAISFFKRSAWAPTTKKVLAVGISAMVGVVTVGVDAGWSLDPFGDFIKLAVASVTQVWIVAQVAYLSFWEGTKVEGTLKKIGSA